MSDASHGCSVPYADFHVLLDDLLDEPFDCRFDEQQNDDFHLFERTPLMLCEYHERWYDPCYDDGTNGPDGRWHNHDDLYHDACDDNRHAYGDHIGMNNSSDDDAMRSSDSSTSHVPSSYGHTTNAGSNPSTKDYTKHTMRQTRTNHISQAYTRKQVL